MPRVLLHDGPAHHAVPAGPRALLELLRLRGQVPDVPRGAARGAHPEPGPRAARGELAGLGAQHQAVDYKAHRLEQLDRLADLVEECLDTGFLKHLLGLNRRH